MVHDPVICTRGTSSSADARNVDVETPQSLSVETEETTEDYSGADISTNDESATGSSGALNDDFAEDASYSGWLVGCIEDLRRFSSISAISRLGSRR